MLPVTDTIADNILEVRGLHTYFPTSEGVVKSVEGASFVVERGKTLCIVGESGSGKSITARSVMQIVSSPGKVMQGEILYRRESGAATIDLAAMHPNSPEIRAIRGRDIAMIFQEPMSSLSPVHTIGDQIIEMIRLHQKLDKKRARDKAIALLKRVGIPRAEERIDNYAFQMSGGQRQRAMIALALSCEPRLLIADEPTTALDVTTQANILDLISELQKEYGMSVVFITHDLGVVAEIADMVAVMYLGRVVERGPVDAIFHDPRHPYTQALLRAIPRVEGARGERLATIRGMVPHPFARPTGCPFNTRCDVAIPGKCSAEEPADEITGPDRIARCFRAQERLHDDLHETAQQTAPAPQAVG
jgi:peptide/nickel transport system ATP-binding protein